MGAPNPIFAFARFLAGMGIPFMPTRQPFAAPLFMRLPVWPAANDERMPPSAV
jgi:hypothetical protein